MVILVAAVGLVALAVVVRGRMGGHARVEETAPPSEPARPALTNVQVNPNSSNAVVIVEQLRAGEVAKQLDEVRELQAVGPTSPDTTGLLLGKVTHQEPEVRKAAVDALVQLDATNAIPGLEEALKLTEDPREKVALMEAIAYLKLPDHGPDEMLNTTNSAEPTVEPAKLDKKGPDSRSPLGPRRQKGRRAPTSQAPAAAQPAAPANPGQTQPVTPVPGGAAPQ
jgi:hypothetical protein